jgi:hypothetical protein
MNVVTVFRPNTGQGHGKRRRPLPEPGMANAHRRARMGQREATIERYDSMKPFPQETPR